MASQVQSSTTQGQNWAPPMWDAYGNASQVIDGLKRKADVRNNFSPRELGSDAGRYVLDQYYAAKGETGAATVIQSVFSSVNLTFFVAKVLPLIGMAAALGVDYAIYGAAAEGMSSAHMPFNLNAFGIGSLIFAGALGLSEKNKNWPITIVLFLATVVATFGASFIAADKNELRSRFTKSLSSAFTTGSDDEYTKVKILESEILSIEKAIYNNTQRLEKGGNNGLNMLADGFTGNDKEAEDIIAKNAELEEELKNKNLELAKAKPAFDQAKRKDPLDFWGRICAALYTGAWLFAAQLMIAEVVRTASGNFKESRDTIAERKRQRKFFLDLENPDQEIRKSTIRAVVDATLSRFSEILSVSKSANKEDLTTLFEESSYDKMVKAATEMVVAGIIPRKSTIAKILKYFRADSAKK